MEDDILKIRTEVLDALKQLYINEYGAIPKEVRPFIKKMQSMEFSPTADSKKKADSILKFTTIPGLEERIITVLKSYPVWEKKSIDTVNYNYFTIFLLHTKSEKGIQLLHFIADKLIENKSIFLTLLKPDLFPEDKELDTLREKINALISKMTASCDAVKWARQIGLDVPKKWKVTFYLSNAYEEKLTYEFDEHDYALKVFLFAPAKGNGYSCQMYLDNGKNKQLGYWTDFEKNNQLEFKGTTYHLSYQGSLLEFAPFLKEIEKVTGIAFKRKPHLLSVSKGVKQVENIEEWLLNI